MLFRSTKMPIIRPLITFDKIEIINKAIDINTYQTSILPYEDCCTIFNPKNPVTKPKLEKAILLENKFNYNILIENSISLMESELVLPNKEIDEFL